MNKIESTKLFFMYLVFLSPILNCMNDDTCHFDSNLVALCTSFKEIIPQICLETYSFCPTYARMARTCTTMHQILGRKEELLPYIAEYALNDQRIVNNMNCNQLGIVYRYIYDEKNSSIGRNFIKLGNVRRTILSSIDNIRNEDECLRVMQDTYINLHQATNLKYEIRCNRDKIARFLVNHGVGISRVVLNSRKGGQSTCLELAIVNKNTKMIRLLLELGADVNSTDSDGCAAITLAAGCSCPVKILNLLLNHGADINSVNQTGSTALSIVAKKNNIEAAIFLLKYGADANIVDNDWRLAISYVQRSNEELLNLFARHTSLDKKCLCHLLIAPAYSFCKEHPMIVCFGSGFVGGAVLMTLYDRISSIK